MQRWSLVTGRKGAATSSGVPTEDPPVEISPGLRVSASGGVIPAPEAGVGRVGETLATGESGCATDWPPRDITSVETGAVG